VRGILTLVLAYSFRHPHFPPLHRPLPDGFLAVGTLPYRLKTSFKPVASAADLSPDHYPRRRAGLVSYYALFQGMAASKPTSQLSMHAHIVSH
jgi:hypothetical protein